MITIRPAVREDAPSIVDVQKKMAMETENLALEDEKVIPGVNAVFSDPSKGKYYVAADGNKVVASMLITKEWSDWRNAWVWWIQSVYVMPGYRRMGVFSRLYEFVRQELLMQNAAGLRLYVEPGNIAARKTYEDLGMKTGHYLMYEWLRNL